MKRIFVMGLYSKTTGGMLVRELELLRNIRRGIDACAMLVDEGFAPFCPWFDFLYILIGEGPKLKYYPEWERYSVVPMQITIEQLQAISIAWLKQADACYLISPIYPDNSGIVEEIKWAVELGIPVFKDLPALRRWRDDEVPKV
jgi:hypothetical protein